MARTILEKVLGEQRISAEQTFRRWNRPPSRRGRCRSHRSVFFRAIGRSRPERTRCEVVAYRRSKDRRRRRQGERRRAQMRRENGGRQTRTREHRGYRRNRRLQQRPTRGHRIGKGAHTVVQRAGALPAVRQVRDHSGAVARAIAQRPRSRAAPPARQAGPPIKAIGGKHRAGGSADANGCRTCARSAQDRAPDLR